MLKIEAALSLDRSEEKRCWPCILHKSQHHSGIQKPHLHRLCTPVHEPCEPSEYLTFSLAPSPSKRPKSLLLHWKKQRNKCTNYIFINRQSTPWDKA